MMDSMGLIGGLLMGYGLGNFFLGNFIGLTTLLAGLCLITIRLMYLVREVKE